MASISVTRSRRQLVWVNDTLKLSDQITIYGYPNCPSILCIQFLVAVIGLYSMSSVTGNRIHSMNCTLTSVVPRPAPMPDLIGQFNHKNLSIHYKLQYCWPLRGCQLKVCNVPALRAVLCTLLASPAPTTQYGLTYAHPAMSYDCCLIGIICCGNNGKPQSALVLLLLSCIYLWLITLALHIRRILVRYQKK